MEHLSSPEASPPKVTRSRRLLRIAMVTETYPPEVNGVANSVARVVDGLRARQHRVQVVRPGQGVNDESTRSSAGLDILTRGMAIPMYGHLRMGLPCGRLLVQRWTDQRPDVVHIATEGPLGWSALAAARKLRLPVCSDFRTNFHAYSRFYGIAWMRGPIAAYLRHFHNRCDSTMVPTDTLKRELGGQGFRSLSVVARGVDTRLFSPAKRRDALRLQWGVRDIDPVALYVGRLAPEKNLGLVLQAFQNLRAVQPHARLVVVGDGPSRHELQAQCPQAIFAGFRSGEDLAEHYASSDLFLFPSLTETFGNVTLEAMASGLAVIAFDDAAAGQLIEDRTHGFLAPRSDAQSFAQLAREVAANPALGREAGLMARRRALELGWDNILLRVEEIYAMAVAQSLSPMPTVWAGPSEPHSASQLRP